VYDVLLVTVVNSRNNLNTTYKNTKFSWNWTLGKILHIFHKISEMTIKPGEILCALLSLSFFHWLADNQIFHLQKINKFTDIFYIKSNTACIFLSVKVSYNVMSLLTNNQRWFPNDVLISITLLHSVYVIVFLNCKNTDLLLWYRP